MNHQVLKFGKKYEKKNKDQLIIENVRISHSKEKERIINEEKIIESKYYEIILSKIIVDTGFDACFALPKDIAEGVLHLDIIDSTILESHGGTGYDCPVYEKIKIDIVDNDDPSKKRTYELTDITGYALLNNSKEGIIGIRGLEILGADIVGFCHYLRIETAKRQGIGNILSFVK